MNLDIEEINVPEESKLALEDKWILSLFNKLVRDVTNNLDNFELGIALAKLYDFIWDIYCDWYIELTKPRLQNKDSEENKTAQNVLAYVLRETLKLLHPFMPFITEEIYQALPHDEESIMISKFPKFDENMTYDEEEEKMNALIDAVCALRNRRAEMNVPPSKKATVYIVTERNDIYNDKTARFFEKLAGASKVEFTPCSDPNAVQIVAGSATLFVPLADIIDFEKEKERLNGEKKKTISEIERLEKKLSNEGFVAKAPAAVIEGEKAKLEKYKEQLENIEAAIQKLQ